MAKQKILTIGLLSIPTHLAGEASSAKRNVLVYHEELKNILSNEVKKYLKSHKIKLHVVDIPVPPKPISLDPIHMKTKGEKLERTWLKNIAKKLKLEHKKYDEILVLGGGHHAAWPLYHLPGKVAYVDQHLDTYLSSKIGGGSYLRNIVEKGIKKGKDIYITGQKGDVKKARKRYNFKSVTPSQLKRRKFEILDIDVDAFPASSRGEPIYSALSDYYSTDYLKKTELRTGRIPRISDIGQAIMHARPRVVSLSEICPRGKRAESVTKALVRGIARLSAVAAAERKFGLKLFNKKKYKQVPARTFFRDRSKSKKLRLRDRLGKKIGVLKPKRSSK